MQNKKKNRKLDDPAQSRAFIQKAKEIGADEEHSRADNLLRNLAKRKPEPRTDEEK
jgi:hypothetical protein